MSTREQVLSALMRAEGELSGALLAAQIGVSRSAVWKAIGQLRAEGYEIEAATKRGYRLVASPDLIRPAAIRKDLRADALVGEIELHSGIDSTNARARTLAGQGAPNGTLVLADSQTLGRGRFGRSFFSPAHSGVYMSLILRPQLSADRAVMLTSLAALAVARAIDRVAGTRAGIKWVNDIYLGEKKVCGILCEAGMDFESGQLQYVVCGIGINVAPTVFPEELRDIATSVSNECGFAVSRSKLIAEVLNELGALYPQLATGAFMAENRARSNTIGREVLVLRGTERTPATAVDIDDQGSLIVRLRDGSLQTLHSGEISLKLKQGL